MTDLHDLSPPAFDAELLMQLPSPLPELLREVVPEQYDLVVLSALTSVSAVLPNVYTYYHSEKLRPNLYTLLLSRAASFKGKARIGRSLVSEVERMLDNESDEERQRVLLPSMTSPEAFLNSLKVNDGRGLIFSTEADTLTSTLGKEYGKGLSEMLRQAYHGEDISSHFRSTGVIHIDEPALSILLTGTPGQLAGLITNVENGLLSRFAYYVMSNKVKWLDPFQNGGNNDALDRAVVKASNKVRFLWERLRQRKGGLKVDLSSHPRFAKGGHWSNQLQRTENNDAETAMTLRAAEREIRLAMVLELLRLGKGIDKLGSSFELHPDTEEQAAHFSDVLMQHNRIALDMIKGVDRDEAIAQCHAEGMSIREIAAATGTAKSTVHDRINKRNNDRQA